MRKFVVPVAAFGALAMSACTPSTAVEEPGGGGGGGGGGPLSSDTRSGSYYGSALNEELAVNNLTYDSVADELIVNNLPFDGVDGRYGFVGMLAATDFDRYENIEGSNSYYAIFRRSDSGYTQIAAVATDSYLDYGPGGAQMRRRNASTTMPSTGEYTYSGDYAAVRAFEDGDSVEFVTGDAYFEVDILDFDVGGAVEGVIDSREIYDADGTYIRDADDYLSIPTASINFENGTVESSTVNARNLSDGETLNSGSWTGLFTGPNGEELAGIFLITGDEGDGGSGRNMRETGVMITFQD